jgi:hypothetical protein
MDSQKSAADQPEAVATARRFGTFRFSAAQFLGSLILLLVLSPFIEGSENGQLIGAVLITLVLATAVLAVGGRRKTMIIGSMLAVPALTARWINHVRPDLLSGVIFLGLGIALILFVVVHLFRFILRAPQVNSEVLCTAAATYLMLGVLWDLAYVLLARVDPGAFAISAGPTANGSLDGFTGLYFSLVTLCTVGYGDITPVSNVARMLAMLEAIVGVFYMAMLISRLVSLYSSQPSPPSTDAVSGKKH